MAHETPGASACSNVSSPSSFTRQTLPAFAFVLLITFIHFRAPLLGKGVFYRVDLAGTYLPMFVENSRLRAGGEIPLWNSHGFLGYPTQAETEVSGVYPPGLIFDFVHDSGFALTLYIIFHFLLAAAGMMYLMRVVGVGILGQTCAAILYVFGGTFLDYVVTLTILTTLTWTPLILSLQLQSFQRGSFRYAVFAGIVLAIQASGANPTAGIHQLLLMCGVTLIEAQGPDRWSRLKFAIQSTACTLVVGLCLSAPQMFYFLEYVVFSERWTRVESKIQYPWSLPPTHLLQAIVPDLWLGWQNIVRVSPKFGMLSTINEYRLYFGIFSLSLILIGFCARYRFTWTFRIVFLGCTVLALGTYTGLWQIICYFPLFRNLHVPWRFLMLASMAAAGLAGVGLDQMVSQVSKVNKHRRIFSSCYFLLSAILLCFAIAVWTVQPRFEGITIGGVTLARCLLVASTFAAISAALWFWFRPLASNAILGKVVICVVSVDLLVCGSSVHSLAAPDYYSKLPPTVAALRKDPAQWRVFRLYKNVWNEVDSPEPALLPQNMAALFGIDAYNSNAAAPLREVAPYWHFQNGPPTLNLKELGLFNVKYFLVSNPTMIRILDQETEKEEVVSHEHIEEVNCRLFKNPYWQPRISIRTQYYVVPYFDAVRRLVNSHDFSLSDSVAVDAMPVFVPGKPIDHQLDSQQVQVVHYGGQRVILDAEVSQNSILVLSDFYYRGWQATSNGKELKILRANGLVRGLALGAGHHRIEFRYRPRSFYLGLYPMGAMIVVLFGYFIYPVVRRARGVDASST